MNLQNKVIVITGGTKGIGSALALLLKSEGAKVVICGHDKAEVEKYESENGIRAIFCDVRKEVDIQNLANEVIKEFGHIDIWVNNAGVFHIFDKEERFVDMEKARNIIDTNFFGTLFGCRTALKIMRQGIIVNVLSTVALEGKKAPYAKIYVASKWAVRGYLEALMFDNPNTNIKILSVYPCGTKTELFGNFQPSEFETFLDPIIVAGNIVTNLKKDVPDTELIMKRQGK